MNQIPTWWLAISAIFFLINIVFFATLIFFVIKIMPAIEQLSKKVGDLTEKVEKVADRVEEVAAQLGDTVGSVGKKTTSILTTIESIAQVAGRQFERISPFVAAALTGVKLFRAYSEVRAIKDREEQPVPKALAKGREVAHEAKKKFLGLF